MSRIILDQEIKIAVRTQLPADGGTEQGQALDMMSPAKLGDGGLVQHLSFTVRVWRKPVNAGV